MNKGLAAPELSRCDKCQASLPSGATACPECGAPVGDAPLNEAESEVYPELARANLARMRGEYKQAEVQLLSILKRYPNNPSANEMLGDLAAEREDYEQAAQWYELALEIVPSSESIGRKLETAREHLARREVQDTTAQLGLPDPSSRMPLYVALIVVLVLVVAGSAYYLGTKRPSPQTGSPTLHLEAQREPSSTPTPPNATSEPDNGPAPAKVASSEDQTLLQELASKAANGSSIVSVVENPRENKLIVTYAMSSDDYRKAGAEIARDALNTFTGYGLITLRGLSSGKVAYMADVARDRLAQTQSPDYQQQHSNEPDAWVAYVLQNEWPGAAAGAQETTGSEGVGIGTAGDPGTNGTNGTTPTTGR